MSNPLAIRSLPPSSEEESSEEEMIAFEANLPFFSSTEGFFPLLRAAFVSPPPLPLRSLLRPRSSPLAAFFRDFPSVFRFFDGGPAPSPPLPLLPIPSDPSVTKPSSSSFFLRPP